MFFVTEKRKKVNTNSLRQNIRYSNQQNTSLIKRLAARMFTKHRPANIVPGLTNVNNPSFYLEHTEFFQLADKYLKSSSCF